MILLAALIAAQAASAPSMTVTPEQLSAALEICRTQVAATGFDVTSLTNAGWPKVMSQGPDSAGYTMATYRHPSTMLMIGLIHDPAKPAECTVLAPTGPTLTAELAEKQAVRLFGKPRSGHWQTESAMIEQVAMPAGIRFTFTKKATQ